MNTPVRIEDLPDQGLTWEPHPSFEGVYMASFRGFWIASDMENRYLKGPYIIRDPEGKYIQGLTSSQVEKLVSIYER